jgi:phage terminase Nu1 subunit (DNA packaging protein)
MNDVIGAVNKRELAQIIGVSLPTLDRLLQLYPDFPLLRRGSPGFEWQFDPFAAKAFLKDKQEGQERDEAERRELLGQMRLKIDPPETVGQTPTQRLALAKARIAERKVALEAGHLVSTAEMRQALTMALAKQARFFDQLAGRLSRAHGLPAEVERSLRKMLDEGRAEFVRELREDLRVEADAAA